MLQTLLILAVFAASFPPPTVQRCFKANKTQCDNVDFPPGTDLAGEGFDITTMQRKGAYVVDMSSWMKDDNSCTLCKNPYMEGQTQKLPVSVVDWRPTQKCRMKLTSSIFQSSESLVKASTSSIENNWKTELNIMTPKGSGSLMLAGSKSNLAQYSMEKTKKDKMIFTKHEVSCGYYRYRVSSSPLVHPELINEIKNLPPVYDEHSKHQYYKLIDKFGTHYTTKVTLGGEIDSVTSISECQASLQGLTVDQVKTCLEVEASASKGMISNLRAKTEMCKSEMDKSLSKTSFASSFSDRNTNVIGGYTQTTDLLFSSNNDPMAYKEWISSLSTHPDVISYSLESIHGLLPAKDPAKGPLHNAIREYILERGLLESCTSPCHTGVKVNANEPCRCSCLNNPQLSVNCCPKKKGSAEVTVTVLRGSGLYGDTLSGTDGYVKLYLNNIFRDKTFKIDNNDNPYWNAKFHLGDADISSSTLKLVVFDDDNNSEDLLGTCTTRLKVGKNENICSLNHGMLYYNVEVTCIPGLTGPSCSEYKPSPMDAQLAKVYVSRNARPIPRDLLREMGVLLNEDIPHFNQSTVPKAAGIEL